MTRMNGEMTVINGDGFAEPGQDLQGSNIEANGETRLDMQLRDAICILESAEDEAENRFDQKMDEITAGMTPKESLAVSRRLVEMCKASRGK